jgi:1,4-dihydroxy-2-naphthoate polyprenyltransferase
MSVPSSLPLEPSPERLRNPVLRYALAVRPAFLTITVVGCLLGFASAWSSGAPFHAWVAAGTLMLALLAHAGINVLNDYYDHLNGTDAINTERLFPFTGGSRFIQNGVLTPAQTLGYGVALFSLVITGGLWLMIQVSPLLFWYGLAGLLIGWAYSAPPLRLNSRGLGELCVAAGFMLIVAGADLVQRGSVALLPWLIGLPYALLVTNILFINQFPDRQADEKSGKLHWVVRLQPVAAARMYALIGLGAAAALVATIALGALPWMAIIALAGMVPAISAARQLKLHATEPAQLAPAIRSTLASAHLLPLLLALSLVLGRLY